MRITNGMANLTSLKRMARADSHRLTPNGTAIIMSTNSGSNNILLYMKGSPNQPQCGFSARTVEALMACGERFAYVDILSNPEILPVDRVRGDAQPSHPC